MLGALSLVLLLFSARSSLADTNVTIESHASNCAYLGAWQSGADYQTFAAGATFTCTFAGTAVYVLGQVCAAPFACEPANTGTYNFVVDSALQAAQFVTPSSIPVPAGATNGFQYVLYSATGLANGTHTVTGQNVVAGDVLWFQHLLVTQPTAAVTSSSSAVVATTSSTTAAVVTQSSTTSQSSSSISSSSSSAAAAGTPVGASTGDSSSSGSSSNTGAIVGGVVGGVVGAALLALLAFCCLRRKRQQTSRRYEDPGTPDAWQGGHYEKQEDAHDAPITTVPMPVMIAGAPTKSSSSPSHSPSSSGETSNLPYMTEEAQHNVKRKPVPTAQP